MGMLEMLIPQLSLGYRFEVDQLMRSISLSEEIIKKLDAGQNKCIDALRVEVASAEDVKARAKADLNEVHQANLKLQESLGRLITEFEGDLNGPDFRELGPLIPCWVTTSLQSELSISLT